jgi:hypothetical protein
MNNPLPSLEKIVVLLGALGPFACSLQDFNALGAGSKNTTGGVDQGMGGGASGGGAGMATQGQGGTRTAASTGGAESGGSNAGVGGRAGTGGATSGGTASGGTTSGGGAAGQLVNPSFESGSTGWVVDPATELGVPNCTNCSAYIQGPIGTATVHQGAFQLSVYDSTRTYAFKVYQVVNGLTDGQYVFSGWFYHGAITTAYLYATDCGGADPAHAVVVANDTWVRVSVSGIEVVGGHCEVGFYVEGGGADWLNADDFTLALVAAGDAG